MSTKPIILYRDEMVETDPTITPGTEATGYDADNLKNRLVSNPYRTTAVGATEAVVLDFGVAKKMNTIGLINTNFSTSAHIILEGNAADAWGAPSFQDFLYNDIREVDNELKGHYFKDGYDTNDFGILGNDLTAYNTPTIGKDSTVGTYVTLNGSSQYYRASTTDFDFAAGDFSVEGWFKINANTGTDYIASCRNAAGHGYLVYIEADGKISFKIINAGGNDVVTTVNAYDDNAWHYFKATRDSDNKIYIFVDATEVRSTAIANATGDLICEEYLYIGASRTPSDYWEGSLSGIKFWSRTNNVRNAYLNFTDAEYRYWRIRLYDEGNSDAYIQIGECALGRGFELNESFGEIFDKTHDYNTIEHRTNYNEAWVYQRDKRYIFNLDWVNRNKFTRNQLRALYEYCNGNMYPFLFIPNTKVFSTGFNYEPQCYYCRLADGKMNEKAHQRFFDYQWQFIEESIGLIVGS